MPSPRHPLAQSESKARFCQRLGLDENNELHMHVYNKMKEEAIEGRRRITSSPEGLRSSLRNINVEPPYSNSQMNETAIHREILQIYRLASPETRMLYDLGRDTDGEAEENWVIRWMLWHVFRYRDSRNRTRPPPAVVTSPSATPATTDQNRVAAVRPNYYWDPVRNSWHVR